MTSPSGAVVSLRSSKPVTASSHCATESWGRPEGAIQGELLMTLR